MDMALCTRHFEDGFMDMASQTRHFEQDFINKEI
jgi:hypothetical protein